jgi:hypothetical protein
MAECEWAILCDYSFLDVNRKVCLIGIFGQITAANVPAIHHQAALALRMMGDPQEKIQIRVEVTRPTGGLLAKMEGEVTLAETGAGELQLNIAGLPLPDYGPYSFAVYVDDALSRTAVFNVVPPPTPAR